MIPLLYNASAGRGRDGATLERLARRGDVELVAAASAAEARELAGRLGASCARVLIAGGDGTVHHALRGLLGCDTVLGIVPSGTGNDFARALGVPQQVEAAFERALSAEGTAVDVGIAAESPFAGIAGVGIVADVLTYLDGFTRRFRGNWVYPWAVLRTVLAYRPLEVLVEHADGRYAGPATIVLAANAPRFGGGMRAAPDASMRDGLLDLVILAHTSRMRLVRLLPRVYRGTHLTDPACILHRTREIRLSSRPAATIYADGEALPVATGDPAAIRIRPAAIRVAL